MKETFYKKIGNKYIPVSEYDSELMDSLPYGNHLIMVYKNGSTKKYNIDPALAPMIAAGRFATESISKSIMAATDIQPSKKPLTTEQIGAWKALSAAFGEECHKLQWPSAMNAAIEATTALQNEAQSLLSHPAVKNAYEEFMLVCKLSLEGKE